jgi:hypothetical protein
MKPRSTGGGTAVHADSSHDASARTLTLEAFADVIIPGEKRWPGDRSVAGAAAGGGAVASGAVPVMESPEGGLEGLLDGLAEALNEHATGYAAEHGLPLDGSVPPFVALEFADRTTLARTLMAPGHDERDLWIALAMFSVMAWDTGAHMHTVDAIAAGHPGLATMGFGPPGPDGLWRFPEYSYGKALANLHPHTTPSGSPA